MVLAIKKLELTGALHGGETVSEHFLPWEVHVRVSGWVGFGGTSPSINFFKNFTVNFRIVLDSSKNYKDSKR